MPVPWESLIPFGLLTAMFGAAGTLLSGVKHFENNGLPSRYNLDYWDQMMIKRDERLTGSFRAQSTEPMAPPGFATSSAWETQKAS